MPCAYFEVVERYRQFSLEWEGKTVSFPDTHRLGLKLENVSTKAVNSYLEKF
jgi:hypothetical protein